MLYSKNGSIPKPETDGTEGWIEVDDAPTAGDGQEVIWCFPPGWVIRDDMPPVREGYRWAYYLDAGWIEFAMPKDIIATETILLESDQIVALDTQQISTL